MNFDTIEFHYSESDIAAARRLLFDFGFQDSDRPLRRRKGDLGDADEGVKLCAEMERQARRLARLLQQCRNPIEGANETDTPFNYLLRDMCLLCVFRAQLTADKGRDYWDTTGLKGDDIDTKLAQFIYAALRSTGRRFTDEGFADRLAKMKASLDNGNLFQMTVTKP